MSVQLAERLKEIQGRIANAARNSGRNPEAVRLIAVTKTHPVQTLQELIDFGIKDLGENRSIEIEQKAPLLRGNFTLHMIGHLQTNKVARVVPWVKWIQSIDRERLISRIEHTHSGPERRKALVEVNTSGEISKSGCRPDECRELCERVVASPALQFCGLMTIGPLGGNESDIRKSFSLLRKLGEQCSDLRANMELSMGMSDDFEWAIEEGSTMVRIGTLLLGSRS